MEKYSKKRQFGNVGEDLAIKFLLERGFVVIERNVLRSWGEIDIVAMKEGILRIIEVKTADIHSPVKPAENMTFSKLKKCFRSAEMYIHEKRYMGEYQIDCIFVFTSFGEIVDIQLVESIV